MSHIHQSSVQHSNHHGYQMVSTQSQNVIMHSSGQPTTPHPPQSLQATNLNDSDPTAAQDLSSFGPKKNREFYIAINQIVLYIFFTINQSLLYSDVNLISYFHFFFQIPYLPNC
jgi:hypothetical protein